MLKKSLRMFVTAVFCFLLVLAPQVGRKSLLFTKGTSYTLYAGRTGSDAQIIVCERGEEGRTKLITPDVTGESTEYDSAEAAFAELKRLGAETVFTERIGEITNYYAYSPRLGGGVTLYGKKVNVHVAVGRSGAAIGSPLIFGGY